MLPTLRGAPRHRLGLIKWNNIYVIDRNVRKWLNNVINPQIFNSLINNSSLSPIKEQIINGDIDWTFTHEWINSNPLDSPDAKLSRIQGSKIKKCNFIYPTADIQQRNYPRLYPSGNIPCINCNIEKDTNEHVGLCIAHKENIIDILTHHEITLINIIEDAVGVNIKD
ncbi:unnamed protein product [Rhizophagus irregularis]|nr:unnamed protein product [Rhizophagus irregularis]